MTLDSSPADQSQPLLGERQSDSTANADHRHPIPPRPSVTILVTGLVFVLTAGIALPALPILRILEDLICRKYLGISDGAIDEQQCKGSDIQSKLSYVMAIQSMLEALPGAVDSESINGIENP